MSWAIVRMDTRDDLRIGDRTGTLTRETIVGLLRYGPFLALLVIACQPTAATSTGVDDGVDIGAMSGIRGRLIAHDSLTAVESDTIPCCQVDSAGINITITGGTLAFYAATGYTDSTLTPEGHVPAACVLAVPNGSLIGINNLVTLEDGESYLALPCSLGYYGVTLAERLDLPDGSSATRQLVISTGAYAWKRDTLTLAGDDAAGATASMSGATITIAIGGWHYGFLAVADQ